MKSRLEREGFDIVAGVMDSDAVNALVQEIQDHADSQQPLQGGTYALRNLFEILPAIRKLAASASVRALVEPYLGPDCMAVRALYFDKLPQANWKVPWHQDLSIAVKARRDVEGFGPWTQKDGVIHAHAPVSLLEQMLTVRMHLDACDSQNGPLRVLPGTHRLGKLSDDNIKELRSQRKEVVCEVGCGGALLMRPLLLHASSPAHSPSHRRVIHLEYAAAPLPDGLEWDQSIGETCASRNLP